MRESANLQSLIALGPDFIGFIFYNKSKRFVSDFPQVEIPLYIKKVGVFVNETAENILEIVKNHNLDYVQLHGDETPEFCSKLAKNEEVNAGFLESFQLGVIKAFSVDEDFDFSIIEEFEQYCDYFIFDTKGENYGGNGVKFNWEILKNYKGNTPFLLSGGISKEDVFLIKNFKHNAFAGIDINSGFEIEPALKNIANIKEFKQNLL